VSLILSRGRFSLLLRTFRTEHGLFRSGSFLGIEWVWFPFDTKTIVELTARGIRHGTEHLEQGRKD